MLGNCIARVAGLTLLCALSACASNDPPVLLEVSDASTRFVWPVDHVSRIVNSGYGDRGGRGKSSDFHRGIDIAAPRGAPVLAVAPGMVTVAGSGNGYGHYIVIDHGNGFGTLYAHLLDFAVRTGDRVQARQRIGSVGKSGNATGYHLHFEVHRSGKTADPLLYLP